ncbi:MAG: DUF1622 domain-containing protein [Rhizobiales bacterium]|nr:DUF1622 domain-containing protein [Hyphomicrobiales bacterium]MBO6700281.1 DUF1622 domain-containing protein [Hyphomicrobiales bacterium]MBO6737554.1 DUF1622 domain-containing protein [Hyphomicrobiales bacterium]MBO6913389.1 DUF1622 domain-containing protein [Hyphomicrobiales bacterium]MBO6955815.1 DUF1622 domain-containing protein [Hyphomicrobiales bacterium]
MIEHALDIIVLAIEIAGIGAIVIGAVVSLGIYLRGWLGKAPHEECFKALRANLGRSILLGLEFLVAADIIKTVAFELTLENVLLLGGIVLIRTFLSFALQVEIEGRLPWSGKSETV